MSAVVLWRVGVAWHTGRVSVTILEREMYSEAAAARLLRVAPLDVALVAGGPSTALPSGDPPGAHEFLGRYLGGIRRGWAPAILPA